LIYRDFDLSRDGQCIRELTSKDKEEESEFISLSPRRIAAQQIAMHESEAAYCV
jgi:hypothetical protein